MIANGGVRKNNDKFYNIKAMNFGNKNLMKWVIPWSSYEVSWYLIFFNRSFYSYLFWIFSFGVFYRYFIRLVFLVHH